ncbi:MULTISPECIES: RICIN domain-containing protein [Streptomyces]|uniref:RICIN domain-containing protein n=1 Tax=Streptomyces liliifuscus TaxID=2797636 RepID=A0A7T7KVY7_9ACTN|nr:RICIN domain-containing protein [Streptomyces liliifuscus]QQM40578.1 RICIN domain-containing protein [Streptomyces liliifuscus]
MKSVRSRLGLRVLGLATCIATVAVGVTATSAAALNTRTYEELKNANIHQYCLDMKAEDPAEGARAQLWNCTNTPEQKFILVASDRGDGPVPGQWTIRSQSARKCLWSAGPAGARVTQQACYEYAQAQSWDLRPNGEIVNIYSGLCLDTVQDKKGGAVVVASCEGRIAQHWFHHL